jgi:IclR family transcriptional regulator, pca regulon regulatory protein
MFALGTIVLIANIHAAMLAAQKTVIHQPETFRTQFKMPLGVTVWSCRARASRRRNVCHGDARMLRQGERPMQAERQPKLLFASRAANVKSFTRGLQVIKTMAQRQAPLTITEVADCTGLTRAGARRLLLTLQELGYARLDGRHFSLTPRIMELGGSYSSLGPIWNVAERHLRELVDDINETVSAGMLDDLDVVYVLRQRTARPLHFDIRTGSRLPAHITSIGRVLLANLHPRQLERYFQRAVIERYTTLTITEPKQLRAEIEAARDRGYALVKGEVDEGVCGVAVPLRERSGRVIAAIGVGLASARASEPEIKGRILPRMQATVDSINRQMWM